MPFTSPLALNGLRLLAVGTAALLLAFHATAPVALALNAFWLVLLLATALLAGVAWARPRAAVVAGEAILAIVALQCLPTVALPGTKHPPARLGPDYGVSWRLAFTSPEHAMMKTLALPNGWDSQMVYLRVDLGSDYEGSAGFTVSVNGHTVGELNAETTDPRVGTSGIPSWSMRVPREAIARAPVAQVILRPARIDPHLSIAGHGDVLGEPLGAWNSAFFDGEVWRTDRLAGPDGGRAVGTYRIWLDSIMTLLPEQP